MQNRSDSGILKKKDVLWYTPKQIVLLNTHKKWNSRN